MKSAAIQTAVYTALSNDAALVALLSASWGVTAIFSDTPQVNADDAAYYPFVSFGPDVSSVFDAKTFVGGSVQIQINAWSRAADYIEVKGISDRIHAVLHKKRLFITGARHVLTVMETVTHSIDPDGETRRALMLFRIKYVDSY